MCKRFSNWWWGIPTNPIEQDEYGNTIIWPLGIPVHEKVWRTIRPAFTSVWKFISFVAAVAAAVPAIIWIAQWGLKKLGISL